MHPPDVEELARRHALDIYRFCTGMLKDAIWAQDATQETFLRAQTHTAALRDANKARSWLFSIAANICRDEMRRRKRRNTLPLEENLAAPHPEQESDLVIALGDALDTLPARQREAVLLFYYHDLTLEQVAAVMHTTRGTVSGQLFIA